VNVAVTGAELGSETDDLSSQR